MQCLPAGRLLDLLAATESVGDDQRIAFCLAHARKQHALADTHRDVVMFRLKAERAGHAAASGIEMFEVEPDFLQREFFRLELHDRFVMAMALHNGLALQARNFEAIALAFNELAERHDRYGAAWKEIFQLIAEDRDATRLQSDDRNSFLSFGSQLRLHFLQ